MNIEQFDERQKAIRNKIMTKAFALAIILLCGAIILNECKVIENRKLYGLWLYHIFYTHLICDAIFDLEGCLCGYSECCID